jgi:hypothetical protein
LARDIWSRVVASREGNPSNNALDVEGQTPEQTASEIPMHEISGYATPQAKGGAIGNAVTDENVIRDELGLPLRLPDPTHFELELP